MTVLATFLFIAWAVTVLAWMKLYRLNKSLMAMNHELLEESIRRRERGFPTDEERLPPTTDWNA